VSQAPGARRQEGNEAAARGKPLQARGGQLARGGSDGARTRQDAVFGESLAASGRVVGWRHGNAHASVSGKACPREAGRGGGEQGRRRAGAAAGRGGGVQWRRRAVAASAEAAPRADARDDHEMPSRVRARRAGEATQVSGGTQQRPPYLVAVIATLPARVTRRPQVSEGAHDGSLQRRGKAAASRPTDGMRSLQQPGARRPSCRRTWSPPAACATGRPCASFQAPLASSLPASALAAPLPGSSSAMCSPCSFSPAFHQTAPHSPAGMPLACMQRPTNLLLAAHRRQTIREGQIHGQARAMADAKATSMRSTGAHPRAEQVQRREGTREDGRHGFTGAALEKALSILAAIPA
jgi:hypothetical protein